MKDVAKEIVRNRILLGLGCLNNSYACERINCIRKNCAKFFNRSKSASIQNIIIMLVHF